MMSSHVISLRLLTTGLVAGLVGSSSLASDPWVYNFPPPGYPQGRPDAVMPDISRKAAPVLNLSTRGVAGAGEQILIAGLVIGTRTNVLIRGIGPSLTKYGVSGVLARPHLELVRQGSSTVLATNEDWTQAVPQTGGPVALEDVMQRVGAFALDRAVKDAAIYVQLDPGIYTAQLTGVGGSTGVALVETYLVKPEIDPFNPAWRSASVAGYTTEGLAPPAVVQDLYGVRLELHDDTALTVTYTTADFPDSRYWNGNTLPLAKTYGKDWIIPVMAVHHGGNPASNQMDAFLDSQLWGDSLPTWLKTGPNTVKFVCADATPEVGFPSVGRIVTLTFTTANSGTYTTQVGLLVGGAQGGSLSKVLASTIGTFVFNRTTQILPTSNDFGPYTGFWIE